LANANAELADRADEITAGKRDLAVQQAELERLEQVVASQAAELGAAQQDTRTATENALAAERQRAAAEAEKAATLPVARSWKPSPAMPGPTPWPPNTSSRPASRR
jgi:hypothetical protein